MSHFDPRAHKRTSEHHNVGEKRRKTIGRRVDWTRLPLEVIAYILSFDDDVHRLMAGLTCKKFRNASLVCSNGVKMKCSDAARRGWLSVLQWLRKHGCPWNEWTCWAAARGGHLEVLQWAREQSSPCSWDELTCWAAAEGGHLEVLQWARGQSPPCFWDEGTCWGAARGGHLEVLQWAWEHGCPWNGRT